MITLDEFVDIPGFFRVEKGSRAVGPLRSVTFYQVGADPLDEHGKPSGRCHWGEGASIEAALQRWWKKCEQFDPLGRADLYWERRRREMFPGAVRGG